MACGLANLLIRQINKGQINRECKLFSFYEPSMDINLPRINLPSPSQVNRNLQKANLKILH